jgi:hypothetical protein
LQYIDFLKNYVCSNNMEEKTLLLQKEFPNPDNTTECGIHWD